MLPNISNNNKANRKEHSEDSHEIINKPTVTGKRSFTILGSQRHHRSQSSHEQTTPSFNLPDNNRGWLEAAPVNLSPSRSLDRSLSSVVNDNIMILGDSSSSGSNIGTSKVNGYSNGHGHGHSNNVTTANTISAAENKITSNQKDILGAVSDEDIFKLTELTAQLPQLVSKPTKHHRHKSNTTTLSQQEEKKPPEAITNNNNNSADEIIEDHHIPSPSSDIVTLQRPSTVKKEKRRSWLYKSIIKPYKSNNNSNNSSAPTTPTSVVSKSASESIIDEYRNPQEEDRTSNESPNSVRHHHSGVWSGLTRIHSVNIATNPAETLLKKTARRISSHHLHPNSHSKDSNNNNRSRSSSLNGLHDVYLSSSDSRRRSADSLEVVGNALLKWDQERKRNSKQHYDEQQQNPKFYLNASGTEPEEERSESEQNDTFATTEGEKTDDDVDVPCRNEQESIEIDQLQSNGKHQIMFDYDSLSTEVKALIDAYDQKGKVEKKQMKIKYKSNSSNNRRNSNYNDDVDVDVNSNNNSDGDDDDEDDDEDENINNISKDQYHKEEDNNVDINDSNDNDYYTNDTIDYHRLIIGKIDNTVNYKKNPTRTVAIVTEDDIEFTKLIQTPNTNSTTDTPLLLDLHVSLFGGIDNAQLPEFNLEQDIEFQESLVRLQQYKKEATEFLQDHTDSMDNLFLYDSASSTTTTTAITTPRRLSRTHSNPTLYAMPITAIESETIDDPLAVLSSSPSSLSPSSSSINLVNEVGVMPRPARESAAHRESNTRSTRSMYDVGRLVTVARNPFDSRQQEMASLVQSLQSELDQFTLSLKTTEDLVNDVQVDIDDTRNRMENYIKDIPESHYSALKKLEVDIELILSKRAKSPWLDTGYALLSYLLTLFALLVWIVIYLIKWGKKAILFPGQLWQTYLDYLVERNKHVKNAGMEAVAGNDSSPAGDDTTATIRRNSASTADVAATAATADAVAANITTTTYNNAHDNTNETLLFRRSTSNAGQVNSNTTSY